MNLTHEVQSQPSTMEEPPLSGTSTGIHPGSGLHRYVKPALFSIWLLIIFFIVSFFLNTGLSIDEIISNFRENVKNLGSWAPVVYVVVYSLRSLIFFPASILTAASGLIFGPWLGILLTIIGENISANISFIVGRYFASGLVKRLTSKSRFMPFFERRFRENAFLAVLSMRLMWLPFDMVGYMSGGFGIRQKHFALGSFFGTIPALVAFVMLGSALDRVENLIFALSFLILGWTISKCLKERQGLAKILSS